MRATIGIGGATLHRETGDKRIPKESTVVYHFRNTLNAQPAPDGKPWNFRRMYPNRHGLTSCRLGLRDAKRKVILWHERYAIEDAAEEFNKSGSVFFQRVDE